MKGTNGQAAPYIFKNVVYFFSENLKTVFVEHLVVEIEEKSLHAQTKSLFQFNNNKKFNKYNINLIKDNTKYSTLKSRKKILFSIRIKLNLTRLKNCE